MTNKIRVLEGLKPVQARPEMYIGSTVNPQQLVVEVVDNALDEISNGYASEVYLNIFDDSSIIVKDNGRGIPIHMVTLENGDTVDSIIAAATILHSGAKFDNVSYKVRIGMHGVGLSVVNALSDYMHIEVAKDNDIHVYDFKETVLIKQETRVRKPDDVSTLVCFKPSSNYFKTLTYNLPAITNQFQLIAAHVDNSKLYLNNSLIETIPMEHLVKYYLDIDESLQLFKINVENGYEQITAYLTFDDVKIIKGDVNLNICAGTYLNTFSTVFSNAATKKYPSLTKSNVLNGLKAYISMSIQDPRFAGQVKHEMVKDVGALMRLLTPKINAILNVPFFKDHFKSIIDAKSMQLASKKLRRKTIVGVDNPLADCSKSPGDILYILEGDSAGGTVKQFRDVETEAIFPLSGKILNTVNKSIDEALESKKVKYLLEAIGVDPSKKRKDFRYRELKLVTDADCLAPDVNIQFIKNGKLISGPISEMRNVCIGGLIQSLNKSTNKIEMKPITGFIRKENVDRPMMKITTKINHSETFTEDHSMFVKNENGDIIRMKLKDIDPEKHVLVRSNMQLNSNVDDINYTPIELDDYDTIKISKIEHVDSSPYIYCLEVADNHNFACGTSNIIVNNCDGAHIAVLVTLAIWKYAPEMIKQKRFKIILPPLYGTEDKRGVFLPIYSEEELNKYKAKNYEIRRFKGLGEMNPEQLEAVFRVNCKEYTVLEPETDKIAQAIISCITDTPFKREICNNYKNFGMSTLMSVIK